jgi:alpha-amylase/alpha-mannosidase (GH57 family)
MRYVCVHGHFYQPPRENPWTEEIDPQPSAAPFHDWNEGIHGECCRAKAAAPILDAAGRTARVSNNYGYFSFNFGPTLLSWMDRHDPQFVAELVQADREARQRYGGHGPAMAQAWGHPIMPLCDERDRTTQTLWGLQEFSFRFGRQSEGFWLPETAVDSATLETLSLNGVRFVVLAPHQAEAVQYADEEEWHDVSDGSIDTRRAYRAELPSGRSIDLFFYDGARSSAIAFDGLLNSGVEFAKRLRSGFVPLDEPQLVHVAVDGETFGHHHRHGEMALAHTIDILEQDETVRWTCYGEFLERFPAKDHVRIRERSAWSCTHELGRWQRDCGCGSSPAHDQSWRAPLREALDALREMIRPHWEQRVARDFKDPWAARDDWIQLLLRDDDERWNRFLERHAIPNQDTSDPAKRAEWRRLFELQQRLLQTSTSCAWFFEDLGRIETVQVLRYAARAIDLARQELDIHCEGPFLTLLEKAKSLDQKVGNGRELWNRRVISCSRSPHQTQNT